MRGGDVNTDDRNLLEYRVPLSLGLTTAESNLNRVRKARSQALPAFLKVDDEFDALLSGAETQTRMGLVLNPLGAPLAGEVLAQAPESERALLLAAQVRAQQERFDEALSYLERAAVLAPNSARTALMLGEFRLARGDGAGALAAFEHCLSLDPSSHRAMAALVGLSVRSRNLARAIQLQEAVVALEAPSLPDDLARLGSLYLSTGRTEQGQAALTRSLSIDPLAYHVHRTMAEFALREKDLPAAEKHLRVMTRYYPMDRAETYRQLAEVQRARGDEDGAARTLAKETRLFP